MLPTFPLGKSPTAQAAVGVVALPFRLAVASVRLVLAASEALAPYGPVRREGGYADQLSAQLTALLGEGGTLDQLAALGPILEQVHPRLEELVVTLPELHEAVEVLGTTVGPLSELAGRIPGRRRTVAG